MSLGYAKQINRHGNKSDPVAEYNWEVSAVHEAGHAVMTYLMDIENFQVVLSDIPVSYTHLDVYKRQG